MCGRVKRRDGSANLAGPLNIWGNDMTEWTVPGGVLLAGKTAVVTGVGPGLGRDIAIGLARQGADVMLVARSDRHTPAIAEEIRAFGRRAIEVHANIASADDVAGLAAAVEEHFGGSLDMLVNSAFHGGDFTQFADADLNRWRKVMDVNFWGTLGVTQALVPALSKAGDACGDARVVMINTMSTQMIEANAGAYAASKGALATITKTLARELGPRHIRVNGVHPGYIYGDSVKIYLQMLADQRGGDTTAEDIYAEKAAETCVGYLPPSEEIAGAVVFFCSPLAKCVTGTALPVNGGHFIPPVT